MNEISMQNNRRLLEVIELLDSKYVEEMFDDLKVPRREDSRITRRPPVKHWKYLASLAACIVCACDSDHQLRSAEARYIHRWNCWGGDYRLYGKFYASNGI